MPGTAVLNPQYTLKGIQDKEQNEILSALRKQAKLALSYILGKKCFMNLNTCIFLLLRKTIKSLTEKSVPPDLQ